LIEPRQFMKVSREWRKPQHEEFEPRNMWSLYNAFTEVYKGLQVHEVMDRHIQLHRFAAGVISQN
jgi:hypothetical protein